MLHLIRVLASSNSLAALQSRGNTMRPSDRHLGSSSNQADPVSNIAMQMFKTMDAVHITVQRGVAERAHSSQPVDILAQLHGAHCHDPTACTIFQHDGRRLFGMGTRSPRFLRWRIGRGRFVGLRTSPRAMPALRGNEKN